MARGRARRARAARTPASVTPLIRGRGAAALPRPARGRGHGARSTGHRQIGRERVSLMHVCGSHEQAIARFGLRAVLPANST